MAVDRNLFMYDLAIVAIMKNEEHYVKEWLDYYLLAGADHFFIYDNESDDNQKEILQSYIDAGLVTYIFYPGKSAQMQAYNDAVQKYKFLCRYMAFIDSDEFILPKGNKSIVEVTDEILSDKPFAGGVESELTTFGSNYLDKADYTRGVLERFTRRNAKHMPIAGKVIANPRRIDHIHTPHYMDYFFGVSRVNSATLKSFPNSNYELEDKLSINHYYCKSREEHSIKVHRGAVAFDKKDYYSEDDFSHDKDNEVFDDSILKYRESRKEILYPGGGGDNSNLILCKRADYSRLYSALMQNMSPTFAKEVPKEFFSGNLENFLICRKLAECLRENILDETIGNVLEEMALKNIFKTLHTVVPIPEIQLLLSELPNILQLKYPVVEDIRNACVSLLSSFKEFLKSQTGPSTTVLWRDICEYDYLQKILQTLEIYTKK